ncbi:MAG: S1C family serine protease [Pirellulales bacterium]
MLTPAGSLRSTHAARVLAVILCFLLAAPALGAGQAPGEPALGQVIAQVQPKIVKVYGAGGFRGMEPYQSGFLISAQGDVLTVYSHVLDTDYISVTLDDGRKFPAKLAGADPKREIALLKIDAADLACFDLGKPSTADPGDRVLAFSNLFGIAAGNEAASVLRGSVSARTRLEARRGAFESPYGGPVYVLDAVTNNPGAAGGALTDRRGQLVGMLGKELRNALNNTWLNYAMPVEELAKSVEEIRSGKETTPETATVKPANGWKPELLGIVLVPDVMERTPPFVDAVRTGSPAFEAGLKADDLVVYVAGQLVQSSKALRAELERIDRVDKVKLTVLRGRQLVQAVLESRDPANQATPEPSKKQQP